MLDDFTLAEMSWGVHPMGWPRPPRDMPRWWHRSDKRRLRALAEVFGPLTQEHLDRYYAEVRIGQSVYEDAGGYMLRCYRGMMGLPVEDPYTYGQAVDDLLSGAAR